MAGAGLCVLALLPWQAQAATPASQAVTVPTTAGATVTRSWTGTIPAGANPTSDCTSTPDALSDIETFTVAVPAGAYDTVTTSFAFSISWTPAADPAVSDEVITVKDGNGQVVGSSDTSGTKESLLATSLPPGTYSVYACGFANAAPQPYSGSLVVTSTAKSAEKPLPSAPAQGLSFSASVASDPQRDESEPLIESAPDGRTYTCGPTGFSNASDYGQVSTDGGDQFHLLGTAPRGQQAVGGGGDCAINLAPDRNAAGNYQYAYAGLGPLTGFTTSSSADSGRTIQNAPLAGNGLQSTGALADRQWTVFTDATTALLSYNQQQPRNIVVQKSTDGGLTYGPITAIGGASPDFPGPMRTLPASFNPTGRGRVVYFGWSRGDAANLSVSYDGGSTFVDCVAARSPGNPAAGFVSVDADSAGNIYLAYTDKASFHTYLVSLPASKLAGCKEPIGTDPATAAAPKGDPQAVGWSTPLQVDRDNVRTSLFPWLAAGGAPGKVAVTFYGTETEGNPNLGTFKASWFVYANQSLNALSASRTFSQVKATTHPIHYDSICLNGLGCSLTTPVGDRSLGDFFAIKTNPMTKKLQIVYNNDAKKPGEPVGHVASPMVITQNGGPSMASGTVAAKNGPTLRQGSADPAGDALANYSALFVDAPTLPGQTNEPGADLRSAGVSSRTGGGFTLTMKVADLSAPALAKALSDTASQSLLYALRFSNGFQPSAVTARYSAQNGWTFKYNDYDTLQGECFAAPTGGDDKCLAFGVKGAALQGKADPATGTITISVPASFAGGRPLLTALQGGTGNGQRPHPVQAVSGSRFYDASVFTLADPAVDDLAPGTPQSYLYPLDNTPAMDFLLP